MESRDYTQLLVELKEQITERFPHSAASNETAKAYLVDGGSHTLRLFQPFPLRIVAAQGAWIKDEDDHQILDFWQGHLGNILGYNPEVISSEVARALGNGFGLQAGFADWVQTEAAEIFRDYLLDRPQQLRALQYGFRPADPSIPLASPLDRERGSVTAGSLGCRHWRRQASFRTASLR